MRFLIIGTLLLIPGIVAAELDLDEAVYRNKELELELQIPQEWKPSDQTGYPSLLLLLSATRGKATVSVAWGSLAKGQDLRMFVAENRKAMTKIGLQVLRVQSTSITRHQALELDAVDKRRDQAIRQVYLQQGGRAFVFTLTCPSQELLRLAGELSFILKGLTLSGNTISPGPAA